MPELDKTKFGIKIDKQPPSSWSFCMGLSHFGDETYLFINLFRVSISIGFMYDY